MAALTQDRMATVERNGVTLFRHPVAANVKIFAGALVVLDAAGDAKPAVTATGLKGAGRAEEQVDNTGGAAGAVTVEVKRGCFRWANDGSVTRAHIGASAYAVDDQTVAATDGTGTRSAVGTIRDLDAQGVWVET